MDASFPKNANFAFQAQGSYMSALYILTKQIKAKFGHTKRMMRPAIPSLILAAHLHVCVRVHVRVYVSVILCLYLCFFCNPSSSRHRMDASKNLALTFYKICIRGHR